jgi:hypothetical protein
MYFLRFFTRNLTTDLFRLATAGGGAPDPPSPTTTTNPIDPSSIFVQSLPPAGYEDLLIPLRPLGGLSTEEVEDAAFLAGTYQFDRVSWDDYTQGNATATPATTNKAFKFIIIDPMHHEAFTYRTSHYTLATFKRFTLQFVVQQKNVQVFARLVPRSVFETWHRTGQDMTKLSFTKLAALSDGVAVTWYSAVVTSQHDHYTLPPPRELLSSSVHGGLPGASAPVILVAVSDPSQLIDRSIKVMTTIHFTGRGRGNWVFNNSALFQ